MMKRNRRRLRNGLSVLEVLFAMGIALVGLLGIASMLPLAAKNASDSIRASEAQSLAMQWYNDLVAMGIHDTRSWQFYQDFPSPPLAVGYQTYPNLPTQRNNYNGTARILARQAVCIDPIYFTSRDATTVLVGSSWYRPSVFPYYLDNFNPVVDPSYAYDPAFALVDQPRMVRVTLANPLTGVRVSARQVQQLFASTDDLTVGDRPDTSQSSTDDDQTMPPVRLGDGGRYSSRSEYSWIATICPTDTNASSSVVTSATLSVAVIYKRDLSFFLPAPRAGEPDIQNKPGGERYMQVLPMMSAGGTPVHFRGGHGGRVGLWASDGVDSQMRVGEWIMLSKSVRASAVHRWYRIVSMSEDAGLSSASMGQPNGDKSWHREVVLDGPDWFFGPSPGELTTATYIPGTVAVYERTLELIQ